MKNFNKLVRDRIPEVIRESGGECEVVVAPVEDRLELLERKLMEEVLFGIAHEMGFSEAGFMDKRRSKLLERGGFKEGLILKKTWNKK